MDNYSIRAIAAHDILPTELFMKTDGGEPADDLSRIFSSEASGESAGRLFDFENPGQLCFVAETVNLNAPDARAGKEIVGVVRVRFGQAAFDAGRGGAERTADVAWPRGGVPALTLAVLSGLQGKGIGRNLLRKMHRTLLERGVGRVNIWVSRTDPALDFFLREGYLITAEGNGGFFLIRHLGAELRIRRISLIELPEAAALITASWKKAYRGIVDDDFLDGLSNGERTQMMTDKFEAGLQEALILFAGGRMAGVSIFGPSLMPDYPKDGEIIAFCLRPELIGSGYGHPLFMATRRELQRRGYGDLVLDVFSENLRAVRFYAAHGFSKVLKKNVILGGRPYSFDTMRTSASQGGK